MLFWKFYHEMAKAIVLASVVDSKVIYFACFCSPKCGERFAGSENGRAPFLVVAFAGAEGVELGKRCQLGCSVPHCILLALVAHHTHFWCVGR